VKENKLRNIIQKLVHEYMGTGSSGGNATDGNDITSPRIGGEFETDALEMKDYNRKNVYGAEGGQRRGMDGKHPSYGRQPQGMFEEELDEEAYDHATLTTQGQSIHRAPGVWEEDEEELTEQLSQSEMERYNQKKVHHQKSIAKIDIEIAEKNREAIATQLQQQSSQIGPQLDNIEKQIYDVGQSVVSLQQQLNQKRIDYKDKLDIYQEIDPEDEEVRLEAYNELVTIRAEVMSLSDQIDVAEDSQIQLSQQRDQILKQSSQAQAQASTATKQADAAIRDQRKAMNQIGKNMEENILSKYLKERKNINLMEQMDMYKEQTEGSLKKFFEMFQNGKTNEEVMQYFAKNGINIPEQYMTKAKKYFESYKKLQLELGFMEQEAKDFKKAPVLEDEPDEEKVLASGLFAAADTNSLEEEKEKKEKKEKKGKKGKDNINIDTDEVEVLDDVESIDGITINIKEVIKKELTKLKK
jgi:hypothetical protein